MGIKRVMKVTISRTNKAVVAKRIKRVSRLKKVTKTWTGYRRSRPRVTKVEGLL